MTDDPRFSQEPTRISPERTWPVRRIGIASPDHGRSFFVTIEPRNPSSTPVREPLTPHPLKGTPS